MSGSISASQAATPVHHHHHHRSASPASASSQATPSSASTAFSTAAQTSTTAAPGAGLAKFASELQSILLSAQSGQPSAAGTTANDPAAASNPIGATDPTTSPGQGGPIRQLADRLQQLLAGGTSSTTSATPSAAATTATSGSPQSLDSVLNTLQQTLQQQLQAYSTISPTGPAAPITA